MTTTRTNGSLYTDITNTIATVEFGHPASNSLPLELMNRLGQEISALSENTKVHALILKSEGDRAFCAGASFDELITIKDKEEGKRFFMGFATVINAMRTCTKPIIARVQGKVVGGGVGLVATCDYVMATENASVKLSELSIGIGPFVIEPAVTRKIGIAATNTLTLDPTRWQNAYWAKENGLYAKVFDSIKDMDEHLDNYVAQIGSYNPQALAAYKKISWEGTEHWDTLLAERAEASGTLVLSEFTQEALQKFKK